MATLRLIVDASGAKRGYNEADRAGDKFRRGARGVEQQTRKVEGSFDRMRRSATLLKGAFAAIGVAVLARGLTNLGGQFVDAARESENYRLRLDALLGSAREGGRAFDEMAKFAGTVPFEFKEIMGAATQLSGVMDGGVDDINKWMPMIADLAAVSGLSIQQTTEQIVRMYSAGAGSADLFRERGITAMLGFEAGVSHSAEETRKQLIRAFEDPQSQFRGASQEMATTWDGTMSMISDSWFQFRSEFMEDTVMWDFLKESLATFEQQWDSTLNQNQDTMQTWATTIIDVVETVGLGFTTLWDVVMAPKRIADSIMALGATVREWLLKPLNMIGVISDEAFAKVQMDASAARSETEHLNTTTSSYLRTMEEIRRNAQDAFSSRQLSESIDGLISKNEELFGSQRKVTKAMGETGESAGDTEKDLTSLANVIGRSVNPALDDMRQSGREAMEQFDRFADAILSQTPIAGAKLATLDETIQAIESDTGEAGDTALVTFRSMEQIAEDTASGIRDSWVDTFDKLFRGQIDSVKGFVSSVKDLFIRMIAEISASLVASQIFKFFGGGGGFSLPDLGGLFGGSGDGAMNLASIGASLKGGAGKIAGALGLSGAASSGAVATPIAAAGGSIAPTAVLTGGGIEAGTGAVASAGGAVSTGGGAASTFPGMATLGPQMAVLAAPFIARELFGGGQVDKLIGQAGQSLQGAQMQPGGAGTQIGAQGGFGVASGPNIGFVAATEAAKNMSTAIVELDENTRAFKDVTMREMIEITGQAEVKFEQLKTRGATVFADLGVSGRQMGNILRDGLVNESEKAALGLQHIGAVIENPKTGMKELGDLSVSQFDRITEAIQKGELRLSALQGKTELSQREMRVLGDIGVGAHSRIVDSARNAAGAEKSFGNTANSVMSMVDRTTKATAKSFGTSFQSAADQVANSISGMASRATGDFNNMSTAARNLAMRMGEIPRTVNVDVNQRVNRSGGNIPGAQHGAVLSGPKSGYLAELHGTEAVIPIKNGSVPVEIQGGGGGQPMVVNINQTINGGNPEDIARATRREFQRVANGFPIR